jgi:hypothetical protein
MTAGWERITAFFSTYLTTDCVYRPPGTRTGEHTLNIDFSAPAGMTG